MTAINRICVAGGLLLALFSASAMAEPGLNASSQTKVNTAKSKMWSSSENKNPLGDRSVSVGSKAGGTCGVNVGTAKPGEKAPKNIVVTTKDVINICR